MWHRTTHGTCRERFKKHSTSRILYCCKDSKRLSLRGRNEYKDIKEDHLGIFWRMTSRQVKDRLKISSILGVYPIGTGWVPSKMFLEVKESWNKWKLVSVRTWGRSESFSCSAVWDELASLRNCHLERSSLKTFVCNMVQLKSRCEPNYTMILRKGNYGILNIWLFKPIKYMNIF